MERNIPSPPRGSPDAGRQAGGCRECDQSEWRMQIFYEVDKRNVLWNNDSGDLGRRGSGRPWQITNRRMDKMSLARQKKKRSTLEVNGQQKKKEASGSIQLFYWSVGSFHAPARINYTFSCSEWNYSGSKISSAFLFSVVRCCPGCLLKKLCESII